MLENSLTFLNKCSVTELQINGEKKAKTTRANISTISTK